MIPDKSGVQISLPSTLRIMLFVLLRSATRSFHICFCGEII